VERFGTGISIDSPFLGWVCEATTQGTMRFWDLNKLWNTDKHRILNAMPVYTEPDALLNAFTFPFEPIERKVLVERDRPLKNGTKLALFRFDRAPPADMNVQAKLRLQIWLGDQKGGRGGSLREDLKIIRELAELARQVRRQ